LLSFSHFVRAICCYVGIVSWNWPRCAWWSTVKWPKNQPTPQALGLRGVPPDFK